MQTTIAMYRNPQLRPGLVALQAFLVGRRYSSHVIYRIWDRVAVHGTLAGLVESGYLEEEDHAEAEATFVGGLPAIDFDNPMWGEPNTAAQGDESDPDLAELVRNFELPEPPDDWKGSAHAGWVMLPPISGASPAEDEVFEPSAEDWSDYRAWSEEVDRRRTAESCRFGWE